MAVEGLYLPITETAASGPNFWVVAVVALIAIVLFLID